MKIGILTHHQAESHGACLQLYALTKFLQQLGHEVYTLTYPRSFAFANDNEQKKFSIKLSSVPFYFKNYLLKYGFSYVWTMARKHRLLQRFHRTHFQFLPYDTSNLDAVIIGSDEVWSIQLGINEMMFGHGIHAGRLISYAPSFGQCTSADIHVRNCRDIMQSGLCTFDFLSVRDTHTQQMVKELTGVLPKLVCDPALLYDFDKVFSSCQSTAKEPYVVVYAYNSDMNEPDQVVSILSYAQSVGAKVYSVGGYHKWCHKQIACDPLELLGWFCGARAVFTDTFHGTISAFLCRTPMAVWVRPTNCHKLDHLLSILGLEDRHVTDHRSLQTVLDTAMDFDTLHAAFQNFRAESAAWLINALAQTEKEDGD